MLRSRVIRKMKIKFNLIKIGKKGKIVKELMKSMKPRRVGSEKKTMEVVEESLNETASTVCCI